MLNDVRLRYSINEILYVKSKYRYMLCKSKLFENSEVQWPPYCVKNVVLLTTFFRRVGII